MIYNFGYLDQEIENIKARKPFGTTAGNPWIIGYRTRGSGFILASDSRQNDNDKPRDLLYLHPGGGVVKLTPLTPDEFAGYIANLIDGSVLA